jgi:hypothetical protein
MFATSPAESVHALDPAALSGPTITFWTAREDSELLGCGALKQLLPGHGKIKSMPHNGPCTRSWHRHAANDPHSGGSPAKPVPTFVPGDRNSRILRPSASALSPARIRRVPSVCRLRARPTQPLHDAAAAIEGLGVQFLNSLGSSGQTTMVNSVPFRRAKYPTTREFPGATGIPAAPGNLRIVGVFCASLPGRAALVPRAELARQPFAHEHAGVVQADDFDALAVVPILLGDGIQCGDG